MLPQDVSEQIRLTYVHLNEAHKQMTRVCEELEGNLKAVIDSRDQCNRQRDELAKMFANLDRSFEEEKRVSAGWKADLDKCRAERDMYKGQLWQMEQDQMVAKESDYEAAPQPRYGSVHQRVKAMQEELSLYINDRVLEFIRYEGVYPKLGLVQGEVGSGDRRNVNYTLLAYIPVLRRADEE